MCDLLKSFQKLIPFRYYRFGMAITEASKLTLRGRNDAYS
jgi:hypothetical protein